MISPESLMYSVLPSFVFGFHGCDQEVGEKFLAGKEEMNQSKNEYDWLGNGIYFWEQSPGRALDYANQLRLHPVRSKEAKIKKPFVIGAVIDLGLCLNLMEAEAIKELARGFSILEKTGNELPVNKMISGEVDLLQRNLDCAVVNTLMEARKEEGKKEYDTIRAVFQEGVPLYPYAGFKEKTHIQICVRNTNCIKGFFRVRDVDLNYPMP